MSLVYFAKYIRVTILGGKAKQCKYDEFDFLYISSTNIRALVLECNRDFYLKSTMAFSWEGKFSKTFKSVTKY